MTWAASMMTNHERAYEHGHEHTCVWHAHTSMESIWTWTYGCMHEWIDPQYKFICMGGTCNNIASLNYAF